MGPQGTQQADGGLDDEQAMRALFDYFYADPLAICRDHFADIFPANAFPYCGEYECCMVRYIPVHVITAIYEKYGFLPEPIKYNNRISSMDAIIGTIGAFINIRESGKFHGILGSITASLKKKLAKLIARQQFVSITQRAAHARSDRTS